MDITLSLKRREIALFVEGQVIMNLIADIRSRMTIFLRQINPKKKKQLL